MRGLCQWESKLACEFLVSETPHSYPKLRLEREEGGREGRREREREGGGGSTWEVLDLPLTVIQAIYRHVHAIGNTYGICMSTCSLLDLIHTCMIESCSYNICMCICIVAGIYMHHGRYIMYMHHGRYASCICIMASTLCVCTSIWTLFS